MEHEDEHGPDHGGSVMPSPDRSRSELTLFGLPHTSGRA